jgi:hypothetical protein
MAILPVVSLLMVVVLSLVVVRVATIALSLTGLSHQLAKFQARSAFTGAGFTTRESEKVVQHPVRRRIIMLLMLLGNAGFITAISSLILSFMRTNDSAGITSTVWFRLLLLAAGLTALWATAHSQAVDRRLSQAITWALKRWTDLEIRDYAELLHLSGDYAVAELVVEQDDWLAHRSLIDLKLTSEGVLVLGVEKPSGEYLGAPRGHYELSPEDNILLYGPRSVLASLDDRRAGSQGNWEHHLAVEKQLRIHTEEEQRIVAAEAEPETSDAQAST